MKSGGGAGLARSGVESGVAAALACYVLWGAFPLLFKTVADVAPIDVIAHRSIWSLAFVGIVILIAGRFGEVRAALANPRTALVLLASATLLSVNWLVFVYAVGAGRVLETSFGYFINPLVYVALGMAFLGERQNPMQALSIGIAVLAVAVQGWSLGGLPWVSLALAVSFGLYGYVRKIAPVGAAPGFLAETLIMLPFALAWLFYVGQRDGIGHFADSELVWLIVIGPATGAALIFFTHAAQRLRLTTLGIFQYLAPSLQFLSAVFIFGEPLDPVRLFSFALIWLSLVIFTWDSWRRQRSVVPARAG
jgi:chloramphenicol-sensitive protein RarD